MSKEIDLKKLPILLYDSECSLCVRFEKSLTRLTDKYNTISIHEEQVYELYPSLNKSQCDKEFHLIQEVDGKVKIYAGPLALEELIKSVPGVKAFSWLIESDTARKAMDVFYQSAAKYREKLLNRCPACKK